MNRSIRVSGFDPLLFLMDGLDGMEKGGPSCWHGEGFYFLGGLSYGP